MIAEMTNRKTIKQLTEQAHAKGKRLVAPLAGFPGCDILGVSIKLAQQNHAMHYNCIEALVHRLKPDAAFMMMDLSVEANALGLPVRFPIHETSTVEHHPIENLAELDKLRTVNILCDARIQSYIKTVEMMRLGLPDNVLVGAYIIGPVTLAGLLEGAQKVAMDSVLEPDRLKALCEFSTSVIIEYARALVNAGANLMCILEPTAAILAPKEFAMFSGHYISHIIESYKYSSVDSIYHTCGNTMHLVKEMAACGVTAVSLDSPDTGVDLAKVAQMIPETVVIGNVNPTSIIKDGTVEDVKNETEKLLEQMKPYPNFILSTGCDIPPGAPIENLTTFMDTGRNYGKNL